MGDQINARVSRGKDVHLGCQWTIGNMQGVSNDVLLTRRDHIDIERHWC